MKKSLGHKIFLTQPTGGGEVVRLHLGADQWTKRAAWPRTCKAWACSLAPRWALLSKNCAHFFMAEMAIWMAGYTTVAIFPTESAQTVRYVLEHSEVQRCFIVGKLDALA
jgi:long-subunit acyl-CoA synthetase (AMP-forming)